MWGHGEYLGKDLCCRHLHEFMLAVGIDQPDFEVGFARFKAQHLADCGYNPDEVNVGKCDFCRPPKPARWDYPARSFALLGPLAPFISEDGWLACDMCSGFIEMGDRVSLAGGSAAVRQIVDAFMDNRAGNRVAFG